MRYPVVLLLLFSAGCASATPPQPQVAATQPAASQPAAAKPADTAAVAAATPEPAVSQPVASEPAAAPVTAPVTTPAPQAVRAPLPPPNATTPVPQAARRDAAPVATGPKPAVPAVAVSRAATAAPTAAPTLDVDALKARLRATTAIGVFTKISLKNKVDDLMQQFAEHYQGTKPSMAELRLSYDLLMMKVLSLLQDGDKMLASDVVHSREAIWALLANEKTFNALQS